MSDNEHIEKLPNAPLVEVIFELMWELGIDEATNQLLDKEYTIAQGVFANEIGKEFQFYNKKLPAILPPNTYNYQTDHQFWKGENQWPVVQLGPGVMAVNDTGVNYVWRIAYKPLVAKALAILEKSYKNELKIIKGSLRYINIIDLNIDEKLTVEQFIKENFEIEIVKKNKINGVLSQVQLSETYTLTDKSFLNISISSGINNKTNSPAIIWQNTLFNESEFKIGDIDAWLEKAHETTSNLFKTILKKELYDSFK